MISNNYRTATQMQSPILIHETEYSTLLQVTSCARQVRVILDRPWASISKYN